MENKRIDFSNREDIEKLRKRIFYSARKFGCQPDRIDDISQEVITKLLEGKNKNSTIDQSVINALRSDSGRKGSPSYRIRESFVSIDENIVERNTGLSMDDRVDLDLITGHLKGWKRCLILLRFRDGMSEKEIGNYFGFTFFWARIWIERIQKSILQKIKAKEQGQNKKVLEKVLPNETETDLWGMEQGKNSGLEKIESWSMEYYNEESF